MNRMTPYAAWLLLLLGLFGLVAGQVPQQDPSRIDASFSDDDDGDDEDDCESCESVEIQLAWLMLSHDGTLSGTPSLFFPALEEFLEERDLERYEFSQSELSELGF